MRWKVKSLKSWKRHTSPLYPLGEEGWNLTSNLHYCTVGYKLSFYSALAIDDSADTWLPRMAWRRRKWRNEFESLRCEQCTFCSSSLHRILQYFYYKQFILSCFIYWGERLIKLRKYRSKVYCVLYTSQEHNFESEEVKIDESKGEHKNWISKKWKRKWSYRMPYVWPRSKCMSSLC